MKNLIYLKVLFTGFLVSMFCSCDDRDYGANPFDPNTPITVSEMPTVISFIPTEAKAGDVVKIKGENFTTAVNVSFGGKMAESFSIESDSIILAKVSAYGGSGTVSVTNHKGSKFLPGFTFKKEVIEEVSNVALGKNGTASSSFTEGTGPHAALDGDESTRWSADNAGNDHWFMVDLGSIIPINKVIIKWEGAFGADYSIEVSEDNNVYHSVFTREGFNFSTPNDEMIFNTVNARYVKLIVTKAGTPWNLSFWELEVHKYVAPKNLALGQKATASSLFSDPTGPHAAVDGDDGTRWSADNAGTDHWFKVDLGEEISINSIAVLWEGAFASDYTIQISKDDIKYDVVFTREGYDFSVPKDIMRFETVNTRYVKLVITKASTPWNVSFYEFEIYKY